MSVHGRPEGHHRYEQLLAQGAGQDPIATAVVYPIDEAAIRGATETAAAGVTRPILVGPVATIRAVADGADLDISAFEVVDAPDEERAAATAVELVRAGSAALLMKGSLHTAVLLRAVLAKGTGLMVGRRLSHVFAFDVPALPKLLLVTDAVVNVEPSLPDKVAICENAIHLAHQLGVPEPKVAILSAVETVDPDQPSSIDAAALSKMADRGQIRGALVDGPLAFDDAISPAAVAAKHIRSEVAGDADILVVPDLDAGNILYKELTYLAGADAAGVVLGASVPIVLASRADTVRIRVASAALGALVARSPRRS